MNECVKLVERWPLLVHPVFTIPNSTTSSSHTNLHAVSVFLICALQESIIYCFLCFGHILLHFAEAVRFPLFTLTFNENSAMSPIDSLRRGTGQEPPRHRSPSKSMPKNRKPLSRIIFSQQSFPFCNLQ